MATKTWTHNGHTWTDPNAFTPSAPGPTDTALFGGDLFGETVAGDTTIAALSVVQDGPVFTGTVTLTGQHAMVVDFNGQASFARGGALATGGLLVIGQRYSGTLDLAGSNTASSAEATSGAVIIGQGGLSSGIAELTGGAWIVSSFVTVGSNGIGDLAISGGGALFVGTRGRGDLVLGKAAGAAGSMSVGGARSAAFVAGTLHIGEAGTGLLSLAAQGYLSAGTLDVSATGAVSLADGYLYVSGDGTLEAGSVVTGSGALSATSLDNEGTVTARGQLDVNAAVSGAGTLAIARNGILILNQDVLGLQHIAFAASQAELIVENQNGGPLPTISAPISGFTTNDLLLVQGVGALSYSATTEVLTLSGGGGTQLQFSGLSSAASFAIHGHQGGLTKIALTHG